ncbi:MAG: tetratricopeptide repeat protein [Treponema sp.]|jgi:Tfp pilus assembly protein PilF|nr:tetratricopeptide repeat protein [Treponema sp.]
MIGFLRYAFFRILDRIPFFRRREMGDEGPEEFWEADFSRPGRIRFDIKSENTYDAYIRGGSLGMGLKKNKCLAWVEGTRPYRDMILRARLRLDCRGGYGAAGIMFRMIDQGTYYLVLLSSKGYFRLDAVRNNTPLPLIGWTEYEGPPDPPAPPGMELTIIASGPWITLLINDRWAGEISDSSLYAGALGFALASYGAGSGGAAPGASDVPGIAGTPGTSDSPGTFDSSDASEQAAFGQALPGASSSPRPSGSAYTAEAFLDYLSVDTRSANVEAARRAWNGGAGKGGGSPAGGSGADMPEGSPPRPIPPKSRLRLAETFAAMGENAAALGQLRKLRAPTSSWEPRNLLLAARLAQILELYDEAADYINVCLARREGSGGRRPPGAEDIFREAVVEKAKILYGQKHFDELRAYITGIPAEDSVSAALPALLGHAQWELGNYEEAALAYDRAFEWDGENGLHGANAANVYQVLGRNNDALDRFLAAGKAFLRAGNYRDLGVLIPKLLALGPEHWEARALAGKWAFGIENWEEAEREFDRAEALEKKGKTETGEKDPALSYLRALLLIRRDKRREALPLLEEAARLAPDYGLFRFRLAENRYLLDNNPSDPRLQADLEKALALLDPAALREPSPAGGGAGAGKNARSGEPLYEAGGFRQDGDLNEAGSLNSGRGEAEETWGWVNNLAAQLSLAGGDLEGAEQYLDRAAAALGETPPVLVNRAVSHYLRGSLDRALAVLEGEGTPDPEGLLANCGGNLLVRAKDFAGADAYYQRALNASPGNAEFLLNRAACLIELGRYGEADALLARSHEIAPSPAGLELIAYVAVKKGEYPRAEASCAAALELDGSRASPLYSLGWIYSSTGRWEEAGKILARLEGMVLSGEDAERRDELRRRILEGSTRLIPCARCGRTWRVPLDPPSVPFLRLVAMPPDELPAGTCAACGTSYCIGCAREHLDDRGRFTCPGCGQPLKLINEGLKKIVADWAAEALPSGDAPTGQPL